MKLIKMEEKEPQNGWLNTKGKFFPCRYSFHGKKAIELRSKYRLTENIEYLGWIKIEEMHGSKKTWIFSANNYRDRELEKPTEAQLEWLKNNNFEMENNEYRP
jgi:hypothetical protein